MQTSFNFCILIVLVFCEVYCQEFDSNTGSNETITVSSITSDNSSQIRQIQNAIQIYDNQILYFNGSNCLKSIYAFTYYVNQSENDFVEDLFKLSMNWSSDQVIDMIEIAGDIQNYSACDFTNKLRYDAPVKGSNDHAFPDDVQYGSRYLGIIPGCNYIITVQFEGGICKEVMLKYSVPACVRNKSGKCKKCPENTNLPLPELKAYPQQTGVIVFWKVPDVDQSQIDLIGKIIIVIDPVRMLTRDHSNLLAAERMLNTSLGYKDGRVFIQMNASYGNHIAEAYFVDVSDCEGPKTQISFIFPPSFSDPSPVASNELFWIVLVFFLFFILILTFIYMYWKQCVKVVCKILFKNSQSPDHRCSNGFFPPDLARNIVENPLYTAEPVKDPYLIDFRDLTFRKELGSGHFGVVYSAKATNGVQGHKYVAVKQLKDLATSEYVADFIEEIKIFKRVGYHENIVKMLGYCAPPQSLCIIMEYVAVKINGEEVCGFSRYLEILRKEFESKKSEQCKDRRIMLQHASSESSLDDYLSNDEIESTPLADETGVVVNVSEALSHKDLESFALQIARGMEHLEKKNIVHRDLAVRNILIDKFKKLKISDFGMSRIGVYINKRDGKFPFRWMPLEAIFDRTYSNKSDAWSYGVVLWEIGTLGAFPYPTMTNDEVTFLLRKGGHLDRPENVTSDLYEIMLSCWAQNPEDRPSFRQLVQKLETFYPKRNAYVDFSQLDSNYTFPPTEEDLARSRINSTKNLEN